MFESGYKIADAWAGLWMDATKNGSRSFARGVHARVMNESGGLTQRGINLAKNKRKGLAYGAVGVSSGAYMWHRHKLNQNQYDPGAPYYY